MRIVIDLQCLQNGSRHRGIGRYMINLSKQIIEQADGDSVHLVLSAAMGDSIDSVRDEFDPLLPQDQISVFQPLSETQFHSPDNDARRIVSELLRERFLFSINPDVVLVGSMVEGFGDDVVTSIGRLNHKIPTSAILYDLIPLAYPEQYLADPRVHDWYTEKIGYFRDADLLMSISESSRNEGLTHGLRPPCDIVNISTGADPAFTRIDATNSSLLRSKFSITQPYLLYTGASDPRKNLPRLIESFAQLPPRIRASHQLVLGGGMPADHIENLRRVAAAHGLSPEKAVFTGHISDNDMAGLYRDAKAFVFPSYHEGFGLPVLEAMQFGLPCVASNRSSVPEVVGMPEALFDPFSVDSVAQALSKVLTDEPFRKRFVAHCPSQVAKFTWKSSAARALSALRAKFAPPSNAVAGGVSGVRGPGIEMLCREIGKVRARGFANLRAQGAVREIAKSLDRSLPREPNTRQIFVDVTALHHHGLHTGIQRVVRNVLKELPTIAGESWHVVPVYSLGNNSYGMSEKVASMVLGRRAHTDACVIDPRPGDIFLGLDLSDVEVVRNASYFQWLRSIGVSVYFVVYDLLPWLLPDCFPDEACTNYAKWLRIASASDGLVGISRTVADELFAAQRYSGSRRGRPLKIGWFHLGADFKSGTSDSDDLRPELDKLAGKSFFLVVATIEPRKGHAQVLEAFEKLWSGGGNVNLVFAGKKGWMVDKLVDRLHELRETEPRFLWFEDLTDAELEHVYRNAAGVIAASLGEGYGLPITEAFYYGRKVIARDLPVFREIAGTDAVYFAGSSGEALADAIFDLIEQSSAQHIHDQKPSRVVSWKESTRQLWDNIGSGRWHKTWMPSRGWEPMLRVSIPASDPRFGTQVGVLNSERGQQPLLACSGEESGWLLYGPYLSLPRGRYSVNVSGSLHFDTDTPQDTYFDIVAKGGATTFYRASLPSEKDDRLLFAEIELVDPCGDMEIRIHVGQGTRATVRSVLIQQSPAGMAPADA